MKLPVRFHGRVLALTGAESFHVSEVLQELWSGYGQILRLKLVGGASETIIAKHVTRPTESDHPRGWNSDLSHRRKVRSYQVEAHWYQHYGGPQLRLKGACCRLPEFLGSAQEGEQSLLLLEDLDAAGYPCRLTSVGASQIDLCLQWLAEFHASFLAENPVRTDGLWEVGTYWHLATRPQELAALAGQDDALKEAAPLLDGMLSQARYQTLVHGDAKLANFCLSDDRDPLCQRVAALDFQYVGGGCGMKDVAYFLGSCLNGAALEKNESQLVENYFRHLTSALTRQGSTLDIADLLAEWRGLYPIACADFHRFMKGWSPTHWKVTHSSERQTREVIGGLTNQNT